jgi:hypothetical protein
MKRARCYIFCLGMRIRISVWFHGFCRWGVDGRILLGVCMELLVRREFFLFKLLIGHSWLVERWAFSLEEMACFNLILHRKRRC